MLETKQVSFGKLTGVIYDFPEIGDELELHVHNERDIHISILARGRLKAFGPEGTWEKEVSAGAVIDWEVGQWHGFVALEPNTRLVNIVKG
jgi:hypothetical protein